MSYLPNDVARCRPDQCTMKLKCLRATAPLPDYGGSVADFTHMTDGGTALCPGLLTSYAAQPIEREVKPANKRL